MNCGVFKLKSEVIAFAFSPTCTMLAFGSWDNTVCLWDVATREQIAVLSGHTNPVCSVVFSPDGTLLASGSWDDTVRLWNVATHEQVALLSGHTFFVFSVDFSPDNSLLASGSGDSTVRMWSMWRFVQLKLQRIALPFLQQRRLSPFTLLNIIDRALGVRQGALDRLYSKKIGWVVRLQQTLRLCDKRS